MFKKVLAVFLAILTAIPIVGVYAFAADDRDRKGEAPGVWRRNGSHVRDHEKRKECSLRKLVDFYENG